MTLLYVGACPADNWATVASYWAYLARENRKSFFLFQIFYKFQTNWNSKQIRILMTSTHTIKYRSTPAPKEKYASA
jgi:hypothetical protein